MKIVVILVAMIGLVGCGKDENVLNATLYRSAATSTKSYTITNEYVVTIQSEKVVIIPSTIDDPPQDTDPVTLTVGSNTCIYTPDLERQIYTSNCSSPFDVTTGDTISLTGKIGVNVLVY